jgi:biopolymer transport protein ExbD
MNLPLHPLFAAWSWTTLDLLNHLWQSTLVGVVVLLPLAAARGLPARPRHSLASLAWVKFVLPLACLAWLLTGSTAAEAALSAGASTLAAAPPATKAVAPVASSNVQMERSKSKYAAFVAISRDGTISLNGRIVSRDDLATAFRQLRRDDADSRLLIEMAPAMLYREFILVTDLARKSGLKKYDLQAGTGRPAAEREAGPQVFGLSELDQAPRVTSQTSPRYPMMEQRAGRGDTVVVEFIVDEGGLVRHAAALPTQGSLGERGDPGRFQRDVMHFEFGVAAVKAVAQWRFTPGRKDGVPVSTRMRVPISFIPGP